MNRSPYDRNIKSLMRVLMGQVAIQVRKHQQNSYISFCVLRAKITCMANLLDDHLSSKLSASSIATRYVGDHPMLIKLSKSRIRRENESIDNSQPLGTPPN